MTISLSDGRRRDALSRERIVDAARELLDAGGERALTFRTLAQRLATGSGAIYWHVANKEELLGIATDETISAALSGTRSSSDPRETVMAISLGVFDAVDAHPWIGSQLSQETWRGANTRIFEIIGQQLLRLGVPERSLFDAASALTGYISGVAGQNAANARNAPADLDREEYLTAATERWLQLDPGEYPFVHRVLTQLPEHDDRSQFARGIDFILAGVLGTLPDEAAGIGPVE